MNALRLARRQSMFFAIALFVPTVAVAQSVPGRIVDSVTNTGKKADTPNAPPQIKNGADACCSGAVNPAPPVQPVMGPQINETAAKARQAQQQQQAQIALDAARRDETQQSAKQAEEAATRQAREAESLAAQRAATETKIAEQRIQSDALQVSRQTSTPVSSGATTSPALDAQRLRDVAKDLPAGHARDQVGAAISRAELEASDQQFRKISTENDRALQQKRLENEAALVKTQDDAARLDSVNRSEARAISERTANQQRAIENSRIDDEAVAAQKRSNEEFQNRNARETQTAQQQMQADELRRADEQVHAKQQADNQAAQEAQRINGQANAKKMADDAAFQEQKRLEHLATQNAASSISPDVGLSSRGLRPAPGTRLVPVGIPDEWRITETKKGDGGVIFYYPREDAHKFQDSVRIMQAKPDSKYVSQRQPYVVWTQGGQYLDANGKKWPNNKNDDTHIPLQNFLFQKEKHE